jgi:hypothetical protein
MMSGQVYRHNIFSVHEVWLLLALLLPPLQPAKQNQMQDLQDSYYDDEQ